MSTTFSGPVISQGGFIGGSGFMGAPAGRVFYVNANTPSAARNSERPWFEADNSVVFNSLQGAIDACVDDRGDVIYVARAYMAITTPVLFNKAGISVIGQGIGLNPLDRGEYTTLHNTTGGAAAGIVSKPCMIYGLGFETIWTGGISSSLLMDWASGWPGWAWLSHCRFPNWTTGTVYGINFEAGANCLVEHCVFEGVSGAFTAGIAFGGSPTNNPVHNQVRYCRFDNCTYAIEHKDGTPQDMYYGPGNLTWNSKFFNSQAQASTGIIFGNYFHTDVGAATFDRTVAQLLVQGVVCTGNEYQSEDPGPT